MADLSILVLEDNPQAAAEVRRILASAGYPCKVRQANARDSFETAMPWPPAAFTGKEDRWRLMLDRLPLACLVSDANWHYTHWNVVAERMFGFPASEVLGKHPFQTIVPPQSQPLVRQVFDRLSTGDMSAHGDCENLTRTGRTITCSWHNTPLLDEEGKFLGLVSLAEDVTERRLAEENRARLQLALEETNRELETVLHVTSHDLRSPLVNIQGFSQELSRSCQQLRELLRAEFPAALNTASARLALERDIPEALHFINASANKMDGLLSGLLRLSRLGRQPPVMVELNMNRLLAQVVETLKFQAVSSGAEVLLEDLPACRGDAMQLNQLFSNLLDNALKYPHPNRPSRVKLSGRVDSQAVVYCVQDNGMGIASEFQERIFELFHRLAPERCPGEGLGLAIAHRIATRHGGSIRVESTAEMGSSFFVSLPL